jgi:hypothetical protein
MNKLKDAQTKGKGSEVLEEQRDEGGKKDGRKRTMSLRFHLLDLHWLLPVDQIAFSGLLEVIR